MRKEQSEDTMEIPRAPIGETTEHPDVMDIRPQIIPKQNNFKIFG
jgi:hypothetical protein